MSEAPWDKLEVSRNQLDQAGSRVRRADLDGVPVPENVFEAIDGFRRWHLITVAVLQRLLERLLVEWPTIPKGKHLPVTSRLKTSSAIVAKLRRGEGSLPRMQDVVGARIVAPSLADQNLVLDVAREFFTSDLVGVKDQRDESDEHGYRSVHIIIRLDGRLAEIQLRTVWQDRWAQIVEGIDSGVGKALTEELGVDTSKVFDLKHGVGPADLLDWLRVLSDEFRKADLGLPYELPPNPYVDVEDTEPHVRHLRSGSHADA